MNYPAGVTGHEDHFGPRRSFVASRRCGYVHSMSRPNAIGAMEDMESAPCEFEGDVDVDEYQHDVVWTCPRCGHEHEEDKFDSFDEDRHFEEQRDASWIDEDADYERMKESR